MRISEAKRKIMLQEWAALIQEQKSSGMNIKNWCLERGVKEPQFYYWQRQIRQTLLDHVDPPASSSNIPELVKVDIRKVPVSLPCSSMTAGSSSAMIPQQTPISAQQANSYSNCIHLQYRGSTLDIPAGTSAEDLSEVLKAISCYD